MAEKIISSEAQKRMEAIHQLSQTYNQKVGKNHQERLLTMMRHHVEEIEELLQKRDAHALVETGDLLILCCELLLEHGKSIDEITDVCMGRFEKKLGELMDEVL